MQIADKLYLLGGGDQAFGLSDPLDSHVYAIDGGDSWALVDSGCGRATDSIIARAESHGLDPSRLATAFITHEHLDHMGGAAYLHDRHGVRVAASSPAATALVAGDEHAIGLDWARSVGIYPADYRLGACPVDEVITDGSATMVGDVEVLAIATPGHSPGHVCYLARIDRVRYLFTGDLLFFGGFVLPHMHWHTDMDAYARSLERLRALDVDGLLPGHLTIGVSGGQRHIDSALERLDRGVLPRVLDLA
jgi:hydroxyacylglutathione hydrolase